MTDIISLPIAHWDQACSPQEQDRAVRALETGNVLLLPQLPFPIQDAERRLLSEAIAGTSKNVSLDASSGTLRGSSADAHDMKLLQAMMDRFATSSRALLHGLLPRYEAGVQQARTSYRPTEIAGRPTSWRKDDTRLHVDSFPSSPTRGTRILRVFSNINPHGRSRTWKLGESFEAVACRFLPSVPGPIPGSSLLLSLLHITKGRRSAYDHFMLQLHDRMKADLAYQAEVAQSVYNFPTGCSWLVYTDQVSHAAITGQYALEQTYHLPIESMLTPAQAPLRVLERLLGRALV